MSINNTPSTPATDSDILNSNTPQENQPKEQSKYELQESQDLGLHCSSLTFFLSNEEQQRVLAAYQKDAEAVTRHALSMGDWIRAIVLDWVSVVERDSSSAEKPVPFPGE